MFLYSGKAYTWVHLSFTLFAWFCRYFWRQKKQSELFPVWPSVVGLSPPVSQLLARVHTHTHTPHNHTHKLSPFFQVCVCVFWEENAHVWSFFFMATYLIKFERKRYKKKSFLRPEPGKIKCYKKMFKASKLYTHSLMLTRTQYTPDQHTRTPFFHLLSEPMRSERLYVENLPMEQEPSLKAENSRSCRHSSCSAIAPPAVS